MRRLFLLLVPALLSSLLWGAALSVPASPLRIAFVPKEAGGYYWDEVHAGALKAIRDLAKQKIDVTLAWLPPAKPGAAAQGDAVVSAAAAVPRPNGLIVAPLDPVALKQPVEYVSRNGTPIVIADTLLSSPLVTAYVGVNNYQAGQEAAGLLGKLMGEQGGVLVVGDYENSANVAQREKGFIQGLNIYPNVQPLYSGDYAAAMPVVSSATAARWIKQFGPKLGGVFSSDDAAYAAVKEPLGGASKVPHIAYGSGPVLVQALKDGTIQGIVAESPFEIGYQSMRAMVDSLGGKNVPARLTIPVVLVTPDRLQDPEMLAFLMPPTLESVQSAPPLDAAPAAPAPAPAAPRDGDAGSPFVKPQP